MAGANWDSTAPERALEEELRSVARDKKSELLQERLQVIETRLRSGIGTGVERAFEYGMNNLSESVEEAVREEMVAAEKRFNAVAVTSLRASVRSRGMALAKLRLFAASALRAVLETMTSDSALHQRLKRDFERAFRYDADGVPRIWKPSDNMEVIFKRAREQPYHIMEQLRVFEISWAALFYERPDTGLTGTETLPNSEDDENAGIPTTPLSPITSPTASAINPLFQNEPADFDNSAKDADGVAASSVARARCELRRASCDYAARPLLSAARLKEVSARFKMEADALYMEAKRAVVSQTPTVPWWVLVLVAVLGWNEFLFILSSPIALVLLLVIGAACVILNSLGLLWSVLGASMRFGRSAVETAVAATTAAANSGATAVE